MKKIALFLCLISVFVLSGCNDDDSGNTIEESGILLAQGSFEGDYVPFTREDAGSDIYLDPTAPDGNYSLRFTFPIDQQSGYAPDHVWVWWPEPVQELWTQYYVKLSNNFFLHHVTQKLTYWMIEESNTNFFIGIIGTAHGDDTRKLEAQLQRGNVGTTIRYISNMDYNPTIQNGIWYTLTIYNKLNTNGQSNGILRVWLDDRLVMDHTDALYTSDSDANKPIQSFSFTPIFGGMGPAAKPAIDYIYFDAVRIQTGPFKSNRENSK